MPKYHPWGTHLQARLGTWPWGNGGSLIMVDFALMEENSDNLISKCEIISSVDNFLVRVALLRTNIGDLLRAPL